MKAQAAHILVQTEQECNTLKSKINNYEDFMDLAKKHSKCPSGANGGNLGTFQPKQMVPEFDKVVFAADIGKTHGPVKTQFGYHLIWIVSRED